MLKHRILILMFLVIQLLCVWIVGKFTYDLNPDWHDDTMEIYFNYSSRMLNGEFPYRDYSMEYPPLALLAFCFPFLISKNLTLQEYTNLFLFENVLLSLLVSGLTIRISSYVSSKKQAQIRTAAVSMLASILCAPLFAWRYDLFPAALTLLSLYLLLASRPGLSGFCIGIGAATKVYPFVVIPVMMLYLWINKEKQSLTKFILGGISSSLTLIPFFIFAPKWVAQFLAYHQQRGLQLESLLAGIILIGHLLGQTPVKVVSNFGAFHLVSQQADAALDWIPYLLILIFAIGIVFCFLNFKQSYKFNKTIPARNIIVYFLVTILTFILTNKVFSPQYIVWILPFIPLVRFRYASLMVVIMMLSMMIFPLGYELLRDIQVSGVLLLNLRNSLLALLLFWLLFDYRPVFMKPIKT
jgi:hypothetical protein